MRILDSDPNTDIYPLPLKDIYLWIQNPQNIDTKM